MQRRRVHYNHSKKVPLPMQAIFMPLPFEKAMQASKQREQAMQASNASNACKQCNQCKQTNNFYHVGLHGGEKTKLVYARKERFLVCNF